MRDRTMWILLCGTVASCSASAPEPDVGTVPSASHGAPYHAADGGFGDTACTNGIDDDGDGLVDSNDPECTGPLDDDERTFATGIPGDNVDPCKQDCFFDGNSGQGDDRCEWNLRCDPLSSSPKCAYDPGQKHCPGPQSQACVDNCMGRTPNGCDCFGCCAIPDAAGVVHTVRLGGECTLATLDDPAKCSACTQQASCANPCERCELCVGKTQLPADCLAPATDAGVSADGASSDGSTPVDASAPPDDASSPEPVSGCIEGQVACDPNVPCAPGTWCLTGCCVPVLR